MALSERMDDGGRWLPTDSALTANGPTTWDDAAINAWRDEPWVFSAVVPDASVLNGDGLRRRRGTLQPARGRSSVDVALLFAVVVLMLGAVVVAVNLFQRV
ncbi:MAG TPA: hypothetical protein VE081_05490 [Sporichthyaceae bacterium]|jgi:hypothetical protein|nr:hypothetical protein [Sporichthyaceae bacterium]